jgi:hypothetical protein
MARPGAYRLSEVKSVWRVSDYMNDQHAVRAGGWRHTRKIVDSRHMCLSTATIFIAGLQSMTPVDMASVSVTVVPTAVGFLTTTICS